MYYNENELLKMLREFDDIAPEDQAKHAEEAFMALAGDDVEDYDPPSIFVHLMGVVAKSLDCECPKCVGLAPFYKMLVTHYVLLHRQLKDITDIFEREEFLLKALTHIYGALPTLMADAALSVVTTGGGIAIDTEKLRNPEELRKAVIKSFADRLARKVGGIAPMETVEMRNTPFDEFLMGGLTKPDPGDDKPN